MSVKSNTTGQETMARHRAVIGSKSIRVSTTDSVRSSIAVVCVLALTVGPLEGAGVVNSTRIARIHGPDGEFTMKRV